MKTCTKCGETRELDKYYKNKKSKDGLSWACRDCYKKSFKDYHKSNREKRLEDFKMYEVNNKDARNEYRKQYREDNRDVIRGRVKEYQKKNPDKVKARNARRRGREKNSTPYWLTEEQKESIRQMYWLADDLRCVAGELYHVDHIVPLKGENVCGLHVPWNLQILPSDVNQRKSNKLEW